MSKKSAAKVFGESFLRTTVIILALVIVGFAGFFIFKIATAGGKKTADTDGVVTTEAMTEAPSTEEVVTEATTEEEVVSSKELTIFVLNSTTVSGLAGSWKDKLIGDGYNAVYAGNYKSGSLTTTKIMVKEDGMGADVAAYFNNPEVVTGVSTDGVSLSDQSIDVSTADIIVIVGSNDQTVE